MTALTFFAAGEVAPQGSKRHVGGGRMVESSRKVKPWRIAVEWAACEAAREARWVMLDGPVAVTITFLLRRPRSHYGEGRNAAMLRASARRFPDVRPDLDKIMRATLDALTEGRLYRDDAQVVSAAVSKAYAAADQRTGAIITVNAYDDGAA